MSGECTGSSSCTSFKLGLRDKAEVSSVPSLQQSQKPDESILPAAERSDGGCSGWRPGGSSAAAGGGDGTRPAFDWGGKGGAAARGRLQRLAAAHRGRQRTGRQRTGRRLLQETVDSRTLDPTSSAERTSKANQL